MVSFWDKDESYGKGEEPEDHRDPLAPSPVQVALCDESTDDRGEERTGEGRD